MYHRGMRRLQAKPVSELIGLDAAIPRLAPTLVHLRRWSRTGYNMRMPKSSRYTAAHASAGLDHKFPEIETWPNQFPGYEIVIDDPEFTSVCPKTGLPDFGKIEIRYTPDRLCLELKSLKEYLQSYRNLGIFQENIVNQVLNDAVRWAKPVCAEVKGDFRPRGGISTVVIARWPRPKKAGGRER